MIIIKVTKLSFSGVNPQYESDVKGKINENDGIYAVRFDYVSNTVTIDYDESVYSENSIKKVVTDAGVGIQGVVR